MLQIFHLDVTKVDLDVAYVSIAIQVCFKCFISFQPYVASVSIECFKSRSGEAHVVMVPIAGDSGLSQPPVAAAGALSWVTVRAPKAGRRLHGAHSKTG
jgi:hypothetical protein